VEIGGGRRRRLLASHGGRGREQGVWRRDGQKLEALAASWRRWRRGGAAQLARGHGQGAWRRGDGQQRGSGA
jgi:hypothetical protein